MIIKGSSRAAPGQLAYHLQRVDTNERVSILELNSGSDTLKATFRDWQMLSEGTRGENGLYHANIDPALGYAMTPEQWKRAVDVLEKELGFEGQPRAIVMHDKEGRQHIHVVWQRTDIETMTLRSDSQNYAAHERASAVLELEFGHEIVPGKHAKRDREKQPEFPKSKINHFEWQQAERTGVSKAERTGQITALRAGSDNGQAFKNALEEAGYTLSHGDRGYILVQGGETFALSRYVEGMKTKDIKAFMAEIPLESLPKTPDVQAEQKQALRESQQPPAPKSVECAAAAQKQGVEASKFLTAQTADKAPEPIQTLKDPEIAAIEKALAERQAVELQKWQAFHAKELAALEFKLNLGVREKLSNIDAMQSAARAILEREHKRQQSDIWERIQRKLDPTAAAGKTRSRQNEAQALRDRQLQERKDLLVLERQTLQLELDALKERHELKLRDVTSGFERDRERYIRDHGAAQRILAEVQEQRRQEEERLRRDGPEPPGRVR